MGLVASLARLAEILPAYDDFDATKHQATTAIKEIYPSLVRLAVVWNEAALLIACKLKELELAARGVGDYVHNRSRCAQTERSKLDLQTAIQANAQAIMTLDDPVVQSQRLRIMSSLCDIVYP
jgi:hypothetical protein